MVDSLANLAKASSPASPAGNDATMDVAPDRVATAVDTAADDPVEVVDVAEAADATASDVAARAVAHASAPRSPKSRRR